MCARAVASVVLLVALAISLVHCSVNLRGVHPADAHLYSGTTFSCKDGSKTNLLLARVNDDYCDCADGSDEPGTSACPNGRFLCRNVGHVGVSLFSSQVNDGFCDCCDGSDEYDGKVKCQDVCYSLGEETRAAKRQQVSAFKKGLEIRNQYLTDAKVVKAEKQSKLEELQTKVLPQREQEKNDLDAQVNALEEKAKAAKELLSKYKPKEGAVIDPEKVVVQTPKPTQSGVEVPAGEIDVDNDDEDDDDDDGDEDDGDEDETDTTTPEEKVELLERTEEVREELEQAEKIVEDLKELRRRLASADKELADTRAAITQLGDYIKLDLGDDAFHGIRDQTFELTTNQYTYKLTPFQHVKQLHTRLGDWRKWLDAEHTKMEYDGGERCWNGPDRKTIVELFCGDTNQVVSVEEPNKCEYYMVFKTPAACTPEKLAQLEAELASLENPKEAILPSLNSNEIF